jgi:hypothetical protein
MAKLIFFKKKEKSVSRTQALRFARPKPPGKDLLISVKKDLVRFGPVKSNAALGYAVEKECW